jgi:hypothetical protein
MMRYFLLAALACGSSACTSITPYAEVTGVRQQLADPNEASVRVMGVNGKLYPSGWATLKIEPGPQMLLMRTTRSDGRRMSQDATLPLDAKPCMRYYVVAKHESQVKVEPWWLEIKSIEPIGECVAMQRSRATGQAGK